MPIGVAIGLIFLGERLSGTAWAGLALVVLGVMAMTLPERRFGQGQLSIAPQTNEKPRGAAPRGFCVINVGRAAPGQEPSGLNW